MNSKQRKTLAAVFERPTRSGLRWADIKGLLAALGAEMKQGRGSRLRIRLGEARATVHEPHPERVAGKGLVEDIRSLLEAAGIEP